MFQKCIVKWNSKGYVWNTKSHVMLKSHKKSKSHEGSQRVTRKGKHNPLVIYTLSLYGQRMPHLISSCKEIERQTSYFVEQGVVPTLHYWSLWCSLYTCIWEILLNIWSLMAIMFFMHELWIFVRMFVVRVFFHLFWSVELFQYFSAYHIENVL